MVFAELTIPPKNIEKQFLNYNNIKNPGAEAGLQNWFEGVGSAASAPTTDQSAAAADITFSRNTTTPLAGSADFQISKPASNQQGEFVATNIDLDTDQLYKPNDVSFTYEASSLFTYGSLDGVTPSDIKVFIADRTTSAIIPLFPNTLDGSGKFVGQFQAGANTNLQLILWLPNTDTDAWDFNWDRAKTRLSEWAVINSDSDWVDYSPVIQNCGAYTTTYAQYRKNGPDLQIRYKGVCTTVSASALKIPLPTGLTGNVSTDTLLEGNFGFTYTGGDVRGVTPIMLSAEPTVIQQSRNNSSSVYTATGSNQNMNNGQTWTMNVTVPIQGWTSGFTSAETVLQNVPAVFSAYKNGGAITANTDIPTWTGVHKDSVGAFNSTTGVYTVKQPGDYFATFNYTSTGTTTHNISFIVNGTMVIEHGPIGSNGYEAVNTVLPNLKVGDTVSVRSSLSQTTNSSNIRTLWSMFKVETPSASMNVRKVATLKEEQAANTTGHAGATFTSGSFVTRFLNTEVDPFGIVSLSSNQFTLQPGTYRLNAEVPGYFINAHKAKLRNITAGSDTLIGSSAYSDTTVSNGSYTNSTIMGVFSITVPTTFEIQHRAGTTRTVNGFGTLNNFGVVEVYTQVEIEKLL